MGLVRLREPLKTRAGGRAEHALDGSTVVALLRALERDHPALAGWILDERIHIRRHINVYVNGEQAQAQTRVEPADRVDVLPAISGG